MAESDTPLYGAAPPGEADQLAAYPSGALVRLLGQCYRGWVKVQPADSVTPGWMWGPNLRPEVLDPTAGGTAQAGTPAARGTPTATVDPSAGQLPGGGGRATPVADAPDAVLPKVTLIPLEPLPLPPTPIPAPAARQVTIVVCQARPQANDCTAGRPLAGVRVVLLLGATRQELTGSVTDTTGRVTLSVSVPAGSQVRLQIPAVGLDTPLPDTDMLTVRLPEEQP
ncbi:MAG TPA: hypothetical protein VFS21_37615 [Roseiflexaceae bacterium]|nr:hypothetical protein [Roseiflexaceae bacterium]